MSCLQYYILKILRYLISVYGILEVTTVIADFFLFKCLFLFYSDYKMSFRKNEN